MIEKEDYMYVTRNDSENRTIIDITRTFFGNVVCRCILFTGTLNDSFPFIQNTNRKKKAVRHYPEQKIPSDRIFKENDGVSCC